MDEKRMMLFRDSSKPEDYWSDGQWKIYKTMKEMNILEEPDDLTAPAHIRLSGSSMPKGERDSSSAGVAGRNAFGNGFSSPVFGEAKVHNQSLLDTSGDRQSVVKDDPDARWDAAAKSMKWQKISMPSAGNADKAVTDIGKLLDGMKDQHRNRTAQKVGWGTMPAAGVKNTMSPRSTVASGDRGIQHNLADSGQESYRAGLRLGGIDPADTARAHQDWQDIPAARAAGHVTQAFYHGVLGVGGKAVDPLIHAYNIYQADYTPKEGLSSAKNAEAERQNAGAVKGFGEIGKKLEDNRIKLERADSALSRKGPYPVLGELTKTGSAAANQAAPAIIDTVGSKVLSAVLQGADTAGTALKSYHDKMLAFRYLRDDEICDPVINPIFGSWCQKEIREGRDQREVAMETRKWIAFACAMKEAGFSIGADRLKKWFGGATGLRGERLSLQFFQNMAMEVVEDRAGKIWETHGEDVSKKVRDAIGAINQGNEWHRDHF